MAARSPAVERILDAADACYARFGIAKTTMEDVASAAGISRATLYRTFADREALLTALVRRRATQNMTRTRPRLLELPTLADRVVEGMVLNVTVGHRDPLVHTLVSPEQMALATSLLSTTGLATELTRQFWEPILVAAQESGELRSGIDLEALCAWFSHLEIMFITQLDDSADSLARVRRMVAEFVVPALVA
ncbi:TetR/AcrR family transcriptional regulator [Pseudonocardia sp. WMMC193]|uniref:TetR/AcrR family transcriptional regulator n=1 Tax=Pseudonocardia sp. WMMC193 TaxID=2911965 RepID=UPI001F45A5D0|nr:TetR/AcrR family transcriptional regulator [Pseudonocardia sp. WMMC193]MCF7549512.1 TetR/AcrR family transcriptional regulator [Pseudonocardia sp. WMMC193]